MQIYKKQNHTDVQSKRETQTEERTRMIVL